jgi:hypothetical protein
MTTTDDLLKEISGKLDKMLKLLVADTIKAYGREQEKIELLDSLGFRPVEIAKFLNKSPDNVSVQLNLIRKKKEKPATTVTKAEDRQTFAQSIETQKEGQLDEPTGQ